MNEAEWMKRYRFVSVEKLTTPFDGARVMLNRWWVVTPDRKVMFFRGFAPQCNSEESIAKRLAVKDGMYPHPCSVEFIPLAFVSSDE